MSLQDVAQGGRRQIPNTHCIVSAPCGESVIVQVNQGLHYGGVPWQFIDPVQFAVPEPNDAAACSQRASIRSEPDYDRRGRRLVVQHLTSASISQLNASQYTRRLKSLVCRR